MNCLEESRVRLDEG